jgi:hypothetical protein
MHATKTTARRFAQPGTAPVTVHRSSVVCRPDLRSEMKGPVMHRPHLPIRSTFVAAMLVVALPARAYTPTPSFGPSPTPTPTGTVPPPRAVITVVPNPARSGQRVVLDGSGTLRAGGFHWSQLDGDVGIAIEDADQAIASFIVPPLESPAEVTLQLALDNGFPARQVVGLLPTDMVRLEVGRVTGAPGATIDVDVALRTLGYAVTELHQELGFDRFAAVAVAGARPACRVGDGLATDSASFTFLPAGCTPGVDCASVRVDIATGDAIPDGAVVYRCSVDIDDSEPAPSCSHALTCGSGEARMQNGDPLDLDCVDGGVTAEYSARPLHFELVSDPAEPIVGDVVHLSVRAIGEGGLPAYSLFDTLPFFRVLHSPQPSGGPLGNPAVFETIADCPGVAPIGVQVNYETQCGCPGQSFFCFTSKSSPPLPVVVRMREGLTVSGRVAASPLCEGSMPGVTVEIDPPGWTQRTDLAGGTFRFDAVPPGDYTLTVSPSCNASGCFAPRPIQVSDSEVSVTICPASVPPRKCPGDCDGDGHVMLHELVAGVSIALGTTDLAACRAADGDDSGTVVIDDLTRAVADALQGCPGS